MKSLKFIIFILAGLTILNFWQSCKKGPEDPFFSIHSRLSRVAGNWNVTKYTVNDKDSLRVVPVDDSTSFIGPCGLETDKLVLNYKISWTFDKNGFFSQKLLVDSSHIIDIDINTPICLDVTLQDSSSVTTVKQWNFTSGVGDLKNKEQLYLLDPETKDVLLYDIIELRNNEMKLTHDTVDPTTNIATVKAYTLSRIK